MLMLIVIVIGCGLGWFTHSARVEREARVAIRRYGGSIWYDWEWDHGNPIENVAGPPWAPLTLVNLLGDEYFGNIAFVNLKKSISSDNPPDLRNFGPILAQVARLSKLNCLCLAESSVSDESLTHLKGLKSLRELDLRDTEITDAGIMKLTDLTKLDRLLLTGTKVTPAGIALLQSKLPGLTIIR